MKNSEIIENAPEGATHVNINGNSYYKCCFDQSCQWLNFRGGEWLKVNGGPDRSLEDINRIIELEHMASQAKLLAEKETGFGGMRKDITARIAENL